MLEQLYACSLSNFLSVSALSIFFDFFVLCFYFIAPFSFVLLALSIPFAFCSPSSYGLPFSGSSNCLLLFPHMVCVTLGCVVACRRPRWSPFFLPYNWSVPRMEKIIPLNSMQFRGIKRSRIVPHVVVP